MKKSIVLFKVITLSVMFVFFCGLAQKGFSQGIAINTAGASANPSSIFDVSSTEKGILIPRMLEAERDAILAPLPTGLLIYQTNNDPGFYYYDGTSWVRIGSGTGSVTEVNTGVGLTGGPITTTGTIDLANTAVTPGTYGSATEVATFTVDQQGRLTFAGNVAIDGSSHTHELLTPGTGINGAAYDGSTAQTWDINFGTSAGTVAEGDHTHTDLHTQQHAITSTADHTASNWQIFYSNGSGEVVELPLGGDGYVLQATGTTSAPVWTNTPSTTPGASPAQVPIMVVDNGVILQKNDINKGVIMTDDNDNCWLLKVDTNGALKTQSIPCP